MNLKILRPAGGLLIVCMAALPISRPAYADTVVTINNFSFEADTLGPGFFTNNSLTGWTVVAATDDLVGAYNPNTFSQPVPDGKNTAYVNPGGQFYQDVGPLVANSTYDFSVYVGRRNDNVPLPTYSIQLLDASTSAVLASGIPSAPGSGDFVNFPLTFDSAGFSSSVGDKIRIEFTATGTGTKQVNFDDVTLGYSADSTSAVPEPSFFALTLLGFGAIAMLRLRRSTAR